MSRQEILEPEARLWSHTFAGNPQTPDEVASMYAFTLAGAHEEHWLIEDGSAVASLVAPNPSMPPKRLDGEVHALEAEGYDGALEFAEERCRSVSALSHCVWSRSDLDSRLEVLSKRGYACIQTAPTSLLKLPDFDATRFADRVKRCPYPVASLAELDKEGFDWLRPLYDATSEISKDVPDPHDHDPMPFEEYVVMLQTSVIYNPQLMFVALDGDRIVGYTRVSPSLADPHLVYTGLSGVVRSHRRQGIVTSLKVRAIETLRQMGYDRLLTDNDIANPMYQLNLDLGFQWVWDWVQWQKVL